MWKDTAIIPVGSTVDLLIDASNPGAWMLHCHIAEHLGAGMMAVMQGALVRATASTSYGVLKYSRPTSTPQECGAVAALCHPAGRSPVGIQQIPTLASLVRDDRQ